LENSDQKYLYNNPDLASKEDPWLSGHILAARKNANPAGLWSQLILRSTHISMIYNKAIELGIAKEQARAILPEGITTSRLYMQGTLRSWLHYIELRSGPETQKEHRAVAQVCATALESIFPMVSEFVANDQ